MRVAEILRLLQAFKDLLGALKFPLRARSNQLSVTKRFVFHI
jgi:hypothetical protein